MLGGGRGLAALACAALWTMSSLRSASAGEFLFQPPVPTRNFAPLQLLFHAR